MPERRTPGRVVERPAHGARSWFLGLILLAGLVVVGTHLGEVETFLQLARDARPSWLLVAVVLQVLTYVCAATAWQRALHRADVDISLRKLVPLSVAKLFSDQVLPSAGASGAGFLVAALRRRGVESEL